MWLRFRFMCSAIGIFLVTVVSHDDSSQRLDACVHVLQRLALASNDDCAWKARLRRQFVSMLGFAHLHSAGALPDEGAKVGSFFSMVKNNSESTPADTA